MKSKIKINGRKKKPVMNAVAQTDDGKPILQIRTVMVE